MEGLALRRKIRSPRRTRKDAILVWQSGGRPYNVKLSMPTLKVLVNGERETALYEIEFTMRANWKYLVDYHCRLRRSGGH